MDPLSALRDYTIRNDLDKILRIGDDFRFGNDYAFPCTTPTAYRSKQGNLYTIETLVYFINNHHLKHGDYFQNTRAHKLAAVTLPDRKPLLDYLQGRVSSVDAIEFVAPQNQKFSSSSSVAANAAANAAAAAVLGEEYRPEDPGMMQIAPTENDFDMNQEAGIGVPENYISLIRSIERPLKDREAILESKNRDFYSVVKREDERMRVEAQQRKEGLVVAKNRLMSGDERGFGNEIGYDSGVKAKMHLKGSKVGGGVPIILVPSAFTTLITMYNVKEFLEDGVFIPTDVKAKQMNGPKPDCVTVQRKLGKDRVVMAYEVRDKPSALKAEDWDRVVAVFVLGKEWQFKDWPFKDHVEIFNKILGFYMRFEDDSVESAKTAKQWNVKIISISQNKRHQDRAAALEVWDRLEEFMRAR